MGLLGLIGCAKDYVTGRSSLNFYSIKSDIKLGSYVLESQVSALNKKRVRMDAEADPEAYNRIRRIAREIAAVSHIPELPYEAHLADVDVINAWCAPGGKIMVYNGLWEGSRKGSKVEKGLVQKNDDNELAAVLAHEIAHATARHVTERISAVYSLLFVGSIASAVIAKSGSPQGSDLFERIFNEGLNIYVPSYSRKSESEADRLGLFYMAKAGYDPRAAVLLWRRAAKERGARTSIYASHPSSGARAQALEKLLPEAMIVYGAHRKKK